MSTYRSLTLLLIHFLLFLPAAAQDGSHLNADAVQRWREDLRFLALEMPKKHANLFHTMTREQFENAVKGLDERIPALSRQQVIVELARIVAMTGDGHTSLPYLPMHGMPSKTGFRQYPVKLYFLADGLFVSSASREYSAAVGGRVIAIGNATAQTAFAAVKGVVSYDNEMTVIERAQIALTIPEVLHALGLTDDMESTKLVVEKDGRQTTVTLKPSVPGTSIDWIEAAARRPLWLENANDPYWLRFLPESQTLYVQFNAVINKPSENIKAFFRRVFEQVETLKVKRMVIDLRNNGGGDGYYGWDLVYEIIRSDRINRKGNLYAIIGRKTFSAAGQVAVMLERHTNVTFAGERLGASPNGYGNHALIQLPNSGISVMVAPVYFQNSTPWDARKWIAPQIFAEPTAEDYIRGRDPVLNAVIGYRTLTEKMEEALTRGDMALATRRYREHLADPTSKYFNSSSEIHALGKKLVAENKFGQAIEVLKLNAEAYPRTWWVHDVLGEAYLKNGNKELAIKSYQESLRLNNFNDGTRQILKSLGENVSEH